MKATTGGRLRASLLTGTYRKDLSGDLASASSSRSSCRRRRILHLRPSRRSRERKIQAEREADSERQRRDDFEKIVYSDVSKCTNEETNSFGTTSTSTTNGSGLRRPRSIRVNSERIVLKSAGRSFSGGVMADDGGGWSCYCGVLGGMRRVSGVWLERLGYVWSVVSDRAPLVALFVYLWVHLFLMSVTLRVVAFLGWILIWNSIDFWIFWVRSFWSSYLIFRRAWQSSLSGHLRKRILMQEEWRHASRTVDLLLTFLVPIFELLAPTQVAYTKCNLGLVKSAVGFRQPKRPRHALPSLESVFRRALSLRPPAFPLSSHDYFWLQDTPENPCQIIGLAITQRMTLSHLKKTVYHRWVKRDAKLTSTVASKFGRLCWQPMLQQNKDSLKLLVPPPRRHTSPTTNETCTDSNTHTDCQTTRRRQTERLTTSSFLKKRKRLPSFSQNEEVLTDCTDDCGEANKNNESIFRLEDHVYEMEVDTSLTTVHEALSRMASQSLPADRPKWRIVLINPLPLSVDLNSLDDDSSEPPQSVSCVAMQIHHGVGDGVGIAYALITHLFDSSPDAKIHTVTLTQKFTGLLYYAWNLLKCAIFGARILIFWGLWCPKPPATFQPGRTDQCHKDGCTKDTHKETSLGQRPHPSGIKHLSPPVLIRLAEVSEVRAAVFELSNLKVTLNDVFAYCLTLVIEKLRSGEAVSDLRGKMIRRRRAPHMDGVTPRQTSLLTMANVCRGLPVDPCDIDLSTPTNVTRALTRFFTNTADNRPDPFSIRTRNRTHQLPSAALVLSDQEHDHHIPYPSITHQLFNQLLEESTKSKYTHSYASNFEEYLQLLIPMTTRTSYPTRLDNFTGPVLLRLPLPSHTKRRLASEFRLPVRHPVIKALVALQHLRAVKHEIDFIKSSDIGPVFFLLTCLACKVLPDSLTKAVVTGMNNRMQLLLTNVIGPTERKFLAGREVKSLQFWPPAKGEVTGGVAILSFNEQIQISTVFDEAEFGRVFLNQEDLNTLTRREKAALSQYVGNMVKYEFLKLHDVLEQALQSILPD